MKDGGFSFSYGFAKANMEVSHTRLFQRLHAKIIRPRSVSIEICNTEPCRPYRKWSSKRMRKNAEKCLNYGTRKVSKMQTNVKILDTAKL